MVRAPRWASMRLKRPSPAPTSRTSLSVYVAALLQHDVVEKHGAAGVAFVDEADVFGGEGRASRCRRFLRASESGQSKRAAIMHEWRKLVTVQCTERSRQVLWPSDQISFLAHGLG